MLRILLSLLFLSIVLSIKAQEDYQKYLNFSFEEIDSLVMIPYQKGDYDECALLMQAGKEKALMEFGEQDTLVALYANNLGFFYRILGKYTEALPLYLQSKNIREQVLGKNHPELAATLTNLAGLYRDLGKYELALSLYIKAKNIYKIASGEKHPDFALSLDNLAGLYEFLGKYEQALPLYIKARNIREEVLGKKHPEFAISLNNLAGFYKRMKNYELAQSLYIQAKNIYEEVFGRNHPNFATLLNNLAVLYEETEDYKLALPLYSECIKIRKKTLGEAHPEFAISLNNLAALHESMGNYELALSLYIQAKDIYKEIFGEDHPDFANTLNNIASLHMSNQDYDLALPLLIKQKNIYERVFGENHPEFAHSLNSLASLNRKMRNYPQAWNLLEQVISNMSGIPVKNSFEQGWKDSLMNLTYPSNNHTSELLIALNTAYELLEEDSTVQNATVKQKNVIDLVFVLLNNSRNQTTSEKDKLRFLKANNDWLQKGLAIFSPDKEKLKAFSLADQNKSVLLLQATKSEIAYRLGELPDSLAWQNKKLLKKQSVLQAKLYENHPELEKDSLRAVLNEANQQLQEWQTTVKQNYPKYHKLQYEQIDVRAEEIQALLDEKTILIEYVISDSILHIFRVDKDEVTWHQGTVGDSILKLNVAELHQSLSDYQQLSEEREKNFRNYSKLAYWFYQKLLAPVLKEGDDVENLVIVTDGELGHLPFESFLVEAAESNNFKDLHYLLKDYNISYNYSATLWKENKTLKRSKNNGEILAMAARYDEKLDANLLRGRLPTTRQTREVLQPLPAARAEVEALAERYRGFFAFDSLASEQSILEKASEYAIIHLAMHGLLNEKRPMLSSLALTEDGDSLNDNFLQAHEISKMELNADLVVLSACETGYGRFETGNGIASLARAFMYAGVPSLVVSLWQVNDASTAIIMQNFYKHLASGMTKSAALRQAKLDYMEGVDNPIAAHPAFWSPFILIGDESPVKIQQKGGGNWLWVGIGAGVLLLGGLGFGMSRRKKAA